MTSKEKIIALKKTSSLLNLLILLKLLKKRKKSLRRWWVKPHLSISQRHQYGFYNTLFKYFLINDQEEFYRFVRMDMNNFFYLHSLLSERLTKHSKRASLPSMLRLASVLCFLCHGGNVSQTSWLYRISKESLYRMIPEVCSIICDVLIPMYVKFPNKQRWSEIINEYWIQWQFPNCIGALDGKHFEVDCPSRSGSLFFNYKKYFSIVLMALCDANYKFTWFDVGDYGSCSDTSIFVSTDLHDKIVNSRLDIIESHPLPDTNVYLPVAIVADEIFGLSNHILKPYSRRLQLNYEQKIFNYRLSRARLTVECSFGMLTSRYTSLKQCLKFHVSTSKSIIAACICLHNYILTGKSPSQECNNNVNIEQAPPVRIDPITQRHLLAQYFTSPVGAVPWQDGCI